MIYRSAKVRSLTAIVAGCLAIAAAHAETDDEAYSRVIAERAAKITREMNFTDAEQRQRVQRLIAEQYRTLRDIHVLRDAEHLGNQTKETAIAEARLTAFEAHVRFVSRLSAELGCDQVEKVKDGMTYGVLNHTYNGYLARLPKLNDEQKRAIRALLIEARELAMDAGSADEKHGVFRKYKGKINNLLSAAGHKL